MSILVCECLSVVEAKLSEQNDSQIKAFSEDVPCKILPRRFFSLFSFIVIICRELKCSAEIWFPLQASNGNGDIHS